MDKIPYIFIIIFGTVALAIALINYTPREQTETGAEEIIQETTSEQQQSIEGSCNNANCLDEALTECETGETTFRNSANTTMIISIAGDGIYQGRDVCLISFYEERLPKKSNTTDASPPFQTWSCKVPMAELRNYDKNNVENLKNKLVITNYCALQVP